MSTYYVSPQGSNTNNGSTNAPFKTLAKAETVVVSGDTVVLRAGNHTGGVLFSGIDNLTLEAEGVAVLNAAGAGYALKVIECENLAISGIHCKNATNHGLFLVDVSGGVIEECHFYDNDSNGLLTANSSDLIIRNNQAYRNGSHGIYCSQSGDNLEIYENELWENDSSQLQVNANQSGKDSGNPYEDGISENCEIYRNKIWNGGKNGGAAINLMGVHTSTIHNNLIYGQVSGGGIALSDDGAGAGFGCEDNTIYHNTIVFKRDVGRFGIQVVEDSTGNTLKANIIVRPGTAYDCLDTDASTLATLTSDYNIFYGDTNGVVDGLTLAAWVTASGEDTNSQFLDPGLTSDFQLLADSPCREAAPSGLVTVDYAGVTRPQGTLPDIGCYEAVALTEDEEEEIADNGTGEAESGDCSKRSTFGHVTFARAYFVNSLPQDDSLPEDDTVGGGLATLPSALLLAKIHVTPNSHLQNLKLVDTRVRGGGIPVSVNTADVNLPGNTRRQAETYWDIGGWDGVPVPLAGSVLVDLPEGVRNGSSQYAQFTEEEILEIAQRHVAAGVRVLVRYR
jgi:hypothetical protein